MCRKIVHLLVLGEVGSLCLYIVFIYDQVHCIRFLRATSYIMNIQANTCKYYRILYLMLSRNHGSDIRVSMDKLRAVPLLSPITGP